MKTFFLEQSKRKSIFKRIFNKATKRGNKIIINTKLQKLRINSKIKLVNKIKKILKSENAKQVALQKELKEDKEFINLLYSNDINICNEKWLFRRLTDVVIQKVLKEKEKHECEICICINEIDNISEEYIYKFAKEFKRINIITNHIGKFKKIEQKLYEDEGILINITNNRRKSLQNAELILNVDFPKEIVNQFVIYDKSIIIDWEGDIKIRKKRFNGKIINDFDIIIDDGSEVLSFIEQNELQEFDVRDVCQVIQVVPKGKLVLKYK